MQQKRMDPKELNETLRTKLLKAPGELHKFVIQICQAQRVDCNLLLDQQLNAITAELEAAKRLGPQKLGRAKAKLEIYNRKRLAAIQVI